MKYLSALFLVSQLCLSCGNTYTAERMIIKNDTANIFMECLSYEEFKKTTDSIPLDTLYIIRNQFIRDSVNLSLVTNRKVFYTKETLNHRLLEESVQPTSVFLSMENLTISSDKASCTVFNRNAKFIGGFKLTKNGHRWSVSDYKRIAI